MKKHNFPVVIQVYLGSGKKAEKLRDNLERSKGSESLSEFIVKLIYEANPKLFKGALENGQN